MSIDLSATLLHTLPISCAETASPLVIALPGAGCSPLIFKRAQIDGIQWHLLDWLNGQGPKDPDSVAAALGAALAFRKGPTLLVGHSLGGFIGLLTAIRYPTCVQGLVLSNTGARIEGHGDSNLPNRIRNHWTEEEQDGFLRSCFNPLVDPVLWHQCQAYIRQIPASSLLEAVEGLRRMDLSDQLASVKCPVLIAHGRHDHRRPLSAANGLAEGIKNTRLVLLEGGHTPPVDCTEDYVRAIRSFLVELALLPDSVPDNCAVLVSAAAHSDQHHRKEENH